MQVLDKFRKTVFLIALLLASGTASAQIVLNQVSHVINDGGDGVIDVGDTITFSFSVENQFFSDLVDVSVEPGNPGVMLPLPIALPEQTSDVIDANYTITFNDLAAQQVVLDAPYAFGRIFACEFDCFPESVPLPDYVVEIDNPESDLVVTKTGDQGSVTPGDQLSYTVRVENFGPDTATGVSVTDTLPAGTSLVSLSGCVEFSGTTCFHGSLNPGSSFEFDITAQVLDSAPSTLVNTACVDFDELGENEIGTIDPNPQNNCDSVETVVVFGADLSIRKRDVQNVVAPGDLLTYVLAVTNDGPRDAENVVVRDPLPAEVSFVSSTCEDGEGADCNLGRLAVGASYSYEVTVEVLATAQDEIVNTATVEAATFDPDAGNNSSSETTPVTAPEQGADLFISKSVSPDPVAPGAELEYVIGVTNLGPGDATEVRVLDSLPAQLTLVSTDCANPEGAGCLYDQLPAGIAVEYRVRAMVSEGAAGTITNTASVDSDTPDPDTANNSATVTSQVEQEVPSEASVTVLKDFSDDSTASVQVALSCTDADIDQAQKSVAEGAPAVFNLSRVGPENRCSASEPQVPEGYEADAAECASLAAGPDSATACTIFNTRLPDETTITVGVSLDDPDAEVQVTLACTDATIAEATLPATNDSPAVFSLSNVGPENTCDVDVSGLPPDSLTDASSCEDIAVAEGEQAQCQVNNVEIPDTGLPEGSNPVTILGTVIETCPRGTNVGGFQELCNGLIGGLLNGSDITGALSEVTPDDTASIRSTGMQTTNVQAAAVDARLGTLRGGGGAGFSASGFSMAVGDFAMSGSLLKSFLSSFDQNMPAFAQASAGQDDSGYLDEFGRWGIWVSGRLVLGDKDRTTNQIDYDFQTAGLTFGMDYRFSDEAVAGIALGYADTNTDLGVDDGDVDTRGYSMSVYGTWFKSDRFYLAGALGYGSNDYDQQRILRYQLAPQGGNMPNAVFNVEQTLAADYSGSQYSATLSGGWDFNRGGWTFGPTLSINYVKVDADAYDEVLLDSNVDFGPNAVGWSVHIADQSYSSLQPALGFEFSRAISFGWGVMIPQGYAEVVSELEDGTEVITGRFLGDTLANNDFRLLTDDFEETFARAGVGLGFVLPNNKSAFITVDGDFGRDLLSTYYINAGFRWQF